MSENMFNPKGLYLERVGKDANKFKYVHFRKPTNKIGRSPLVDVSFYTGEPNTVSKEQSLVVFKNGRMYISNLSRTNPTFLNNDMVIHKTEVEEGDLLGFGSKPNGTYPNFEEEQIFIYECKSLNKSRQQKVIILDDSGDEDLEIIEIIDENENPIQSAPTENLELKNECKSEVTIEPSPKIAENKLEHTNEVVEPPSDKSMSFYHDTVEKINDCANSDSEEEEYHEHVIKDITIVVKKLTDEELKQWKPREEKEHLEKKEMEKFLPNGLNFSKTKLETLTKSLEMREKILKITDKDSDDESLLKNVIPISDSKNSEAAIKPSSNRIESLVKSIPSQKRRASTNEKYKTSYSYEKKQRTEESTSRPPLLKFPGSETNVTINDKIPMKNRRASLSELKNDTDSGDSMRKISNSNKILKRRMSVCPSSIPKIIAAPAKKVRKPPQRRQTISESRFTEFDMFSKASELRLKKWGHLSKDNDKKEVPKPPDIDKSVKKPKFTANEITERSNEKKIEEAKKIPPAPPSKNEINKNGEDKNEDLKKASALKVKYTTKTRGHCLTEAIPLNPIKSAARRNSIFNDQQPSTSKEAITISSFREKYIKPIDVPVPDPVVSKVPSNEPFIDVNLDSVNEQISLDMKMRNEQLATSSVQEPRSPATSSSEELNFDTDDEDKEETLGFYTLINEKTPQEDILLPQTDPDFGSPMKDDPRGKTKWVSSQQNEIEEQSERTLGLQPFPTTPNFTTTIYVHHEKIPPEDIKQILKTSSNYAPRPKDQSHNKRVSFNEYRLVDIKYIDADSNNSNQQVAHVPPMRHSIRHPKNFESIACADIMEWDWKWLTLNNELPEGWKVEPYKTSYSSLQEYKNELKTVLNVELLKRLSSKYKTIATKDKTWNFMTVKERKDEPNNHIKLILGCDSKDLKQGTMLLLKVRDTNSITRKPVDIYFLGYITAVNDRGELKLDTYCKELRKEKAVLKSTCLIHLRNDLKLFAVLNCIQDTPLMKMFLNPSVNKMDRNEGMTSVNLEYEISSLRLCPEQRIVVKKLSYECTKDDSERIIFINGGAGTGKTYTMLATVLNLQLNKDKKRYLICTPTMSGIDQIAETLYNLPHSSALNIVRVGFREQSVGRGRKLWINEQVQQRINNGIKGKSYKEIQKEIIESADIILATCKGCYDLFDYEIYCDTCFIDEANYAIDAELMVPIHLNIKKLVFIGDEYQLEPTQSLVFKESRSNNSYFNRIINYYKSIKFANAPVFTLITQHRMNKDLFNICNKYVYNETMTYNPANSMPNSSYFPFKPFAVFTLNVMPNDQRPMKDEINIFCMKLCEILPKSVSIGILNGFPSLRDKSKARLNTEDSRVECLAVETIQGIEKDVIILTLRNTETYFMHNFNRINVALTRARKALYVCSNMNMILYPNEAGLFLQLKDDAKTHGLYHVIQNFDSDRLYNILKK